MRRSTILLLALPLLLSGCPEDPMFDDCYFDLAIEQMCSTSTNLSCTKFSCVVEEHPQCVEGICLSFEGSSPRCTKSCNPDNDTCPEGSTCREYAEITSTGDKKYACVKNSDVESYLFATTQDECKPENWVSYKNQAFCSRSCKPDCDDGSDCVYEEGMFRCLDQCTTNNDCPDNGKCVALSGRYYCADVCPESKQCGNGKSCLLSDGTYYCVEDDNHESCEPNQGCPGQAFCQELGGEDFYCVPCTLGITEYNADQ